MAEPFAIPNEVEGVLGTEFVLGTDTSVKLSAIGLFDTGGGHVRVQTTEGAHWALVTYTGVSTNDLTGITQVGLSGQLCSTGDDAYTFPTGSYVYRVCMGEDVSKRIMGPASATDGHFFKANGTTGKLAKAEAIAPTDLPAETARARVYRNGDQTGVVTSTATKVQFNAETYDPGANFDSATNYRFVAPVAGYYIVAAAIRYKANIVADKGYWAFILVNGTGGVGSTSSHSSNDGQISVPVLAVVYLAVNDYVELMAYHSAGSNMIIDGANAENTYMAVSRIGT